MKQRTPFWSILLTIFCLSNLTYAAGSPQFKSFKFLKAHNSMLARDVNGTITKDTIHVQFPFFADITHLKASFETDAKKIAIAGRLQVSDKTANNFRHEMIYTLIDAQGTHKRYYVRVKNLNLGHPIVYINTEDNRNIVSKDYYINAYMTIDGIGKYTSLPTTKVEVKGRGNSTWWMFPKKPYAVKMFKETKSEILDMPEHRKWVLLANWMDRTLLRNVASYRISTIIGFEWVTRCRFVEVMLNGKHIGLYVMCEKVEVDENRLDITELEKTDLSEPNIKGGYLLELDNNFDNVYKFKSKYRKLPVMVKTPDDDDLQTAQFNYIRDYFNDVEEMLHRGEYQKAYQKMDVSSFADYYIAYELAGNHEPTNPRSAYMHKDRYGKLKAGPVWDFDWGTYRFHSNRFINQKAIFYTYLFNDPHFIEVLKERWNACREELLTVSDFIDEQREFIRDSEELNHELWPFPKKQTTNEDEQLSFDEAVDKMIRAYEARYYLLDHHYGNPTALDDMEDEPKARVYARNGTIVVECSDEYLSLYSGTAQAAVYSMQGARLASRELQDETTTIQMPAGTYLLVLNSISQIVIVP